MKHLQLKRHNNIYADTSLFGHNNKNVHGTSWIPPPLTKIAPNWSNFKVCERRGKWEKKWHLPTSCGFNYQGKLGRSGGEAASRHLARKYCVHWWMSARPSSFLSAPSSFGLAAPPAIRQPTVNMSTMSGRPARSTSAGWFCMLSLYSFSVDLPTKLWAPMPTTCRLPPP